jgi:hypothetical protein
MSRLTLRGLLAITLTLGALALTDLAKPPAMLAYLRQTAR